MSSSGTLQKISSGFVLPSSVDSEDDGKWDHEIKKDVDVRDKKDENEEEYEAFRQARRRGRNYTVEEKISRNHLYKPERKGSDKEEKDNGITDGWNDSNHVSHNTTSSSSGVKARLMEYLKSAPDHESIWDKEIDEDTKCLILSCLGVPSGSIDKLGDIFQSKFFNRLGLTPQEKDRCQHREQPKIIPPKIASHVGSSNLINVIRFVDTERIIVGCGNG